VTINGVDVGPLINTELDRRYPERAKMRPTTPSAFREAWDTVARLWGGTVEGRPYRTGGGAGVAPAAELPGP
jgi:hypothetical protein